MIVNPQNKGLRKRRRTIFLRCKLLPKSYGPFKVLDVGETTVTIEQNGISNRFSRDLVTTVPLTTGTEEDDV